MKEGGERIGGRARRSGGRGEGKKLEDREKGNGEGRKKKKGYRRRKKKRRTIRIVKGIK